MPTTRAGTRMPSLLPSTDGSRGDCGVGGANRSLEGVSSQEAPGVGETANGSPMARSLELPGRGCLRAGSDGGRAGRPSVGCVSMDAVPDDLVSTAGAAD